MFIRTTDGSLTEQIVYHMKRPACCHPGMKVADDRTLSSER